MLPLKASLKKVQSFKKKPQECSYSCVALSSSSEVFFQRASLGMWLLCDTNSQQEVLLLVLIFLVTASQSKSLVTYDSTVYN